MARKRLELWTTSILFRAEQLPWHSFFLHFVSQIFLSIRERAASRPRSVSYYNFCVVCKLFSQPEPVSQRMSVHLISHHRNICHFKSIVRTTVSCIDGLTQYLNEYFNFNRLVFEKWRRCNRAPKASVFCWLAADTHSFPFFGRYKSKN